MRSNFGSTTFSFCKLVTIFSLVFTSISDAQTNLSQNKLTEITDFSFPSLKRFTDRDGLPINTVMTLESDKRGYLWIGTQDGAAFHNGHRFTVLNMPNRAVSNYIYDILAANDGSVWFATGGGGIHHYESGAWKTHSAESGLASQEIRCLLETESVDGSQIIWAGRRDGLSKLENGTWTNFDEKSGLPDKRVRSLLETSDGDGSKTLWIGTYGGIAAWKGEDKNVIDEKSGLPGKIVFSLLETKLENGESIIWAGTDKGLAKFANGTWQTFENESEIFTRSVRALGKTKKADGTETVWVGFDGEGAAFYERGIWKFIQEKDGLSNDSVYAFAETGSPDGSVWMSNLGAGITRFERSNWRYFDDKNGLPKKIVFAVEEMISLGGNSSFWIGTFEGGLSRFENGKWTNFNKTNGLSNEFVQALHASTDENGEEILYVGTEKGLSSFQNGKWRDIGLNETVPLIEVWDIKEALSENGKKTLLISTSVGLIKKTGENIEKINSKNGLSDDRVRDALETHSKEGEKVLWVGTYNGGLARFENGEWTIFDVKNGFPTNRIYKIAEINIENSRQLWVATGGGGIAILDLDQPETGFQLIKTENSNLVPSDTVYSIFQDTKKQIYATTNKGVSRITYKNNSLSAYFFTTEDGLPSNECVSGASYIDSKGRVWIGTVGGAAVLDISKEFEDEIAQPLFLEKVIVADIERQLLPETQLKYDENDLIFEFAMPNGFRDASTNYQTQLVGLEEQPTEWTNEPRRQYNFLPSGNFTFKVWARDFAGNISVPLELPFRIRPAWWQSWWAFMLYLMATVAIVTFIVYLFYRNRLKRMLEIERVRTRIATDLHDDVGSSLSKISILSEVLSHNEGELDLEDKRSLETIAETSREVVGSMSDMVWSINPSRDNLRDTIQRMRRFASETLSLRNIDFRFTAPQSDKEIKLNVDYRRQIYLIFKESLNNAVKHSNCSKVDIELGQKGKWLELKISDDGRGFDNSVETEGNGLINMRSRAENIGGKFEIVSENGKGTIILLKIPQKSGIFTT